MKLLISSFALWAVAVSAIPQHKTYAHDIDELNNGAISTTGSWNSNDTSAITMPSPFPTFRVNTSIITDRIDTGSPFPTDSSHFTAPTPTGSSDTSVTTDPFHPTWPSIPWTTIPPWPRRMSTRENVTTPKPTWHPSGSPTHTHSESSTETSSDVPVGEPTDSVTALPTHDSHEVTRMPIAESSLKPKVARDIEPCTDANEPWSTWMDWPSDKVITQAPPQTTPFTSLIRAGRGEQAGTHQQNGQAVGAMLTAAEKIRNPFVLECFNNDVGDPKLTEQCRAGKQKVSGVGIGSFCTPLGEVKTSDRICQAACKCLRT